MKKLITTLALAISLCSTAQAAKTPEQVCQKLAEKASKDSFWLAVGAGMAGNMANTHHYTSRGSYSFNGQTQYYSSTIAVTNHYAAAQDATRINASAQSERKRKLRAEYNALECDKTLGLVPVDAWSSGARKMKKRGDAE